MDKRDPQAAAGEVALPQDNKPASWDVRLEDAILRGGIFSVRHWLAIACLALAIFIALPLAAPLLMANGLTEPAQAIYTMYHATCHQEPARSFFVGGPHAIYSRSELESLTPVRPLAAFVGSPAMGYKVAFCERDVAMYVSILVFLVFYGAMRRKAPRLPLWLYVLLILPLAIDGLTQLTGLRESTWLLRTITGTLFGVATAWLLLPEVDKGMTATRKQFEADRVRLEQR